MALVYNLLNCCSEHFADSKILIGPISGIVPQNNNFCCHSLCILSRWVENGLILLAPMFNAM